jgi:tRNA threonylcarbamoyladenosine biosynthesis protein TsaB
MFANSAPVAQECVDVSSTRAPEVTLAFDASSRRASLALWVEARLLHTHGVAMGAGTGDALFPALQSMLAEHNLRPRALTRVVCGAGPGSFTSLRIAAAIAKALVVPNTSALFGVPSLLWRAASALGGSKASSGEAVDEVGGAAVDGTWLSVSDALRGDVYVSAVRTQLAADRARTVYALGDVARIPYTDVARWAVMHEVQGIIADDVAAGGLARGTHVRVPVRSAVIEASALSHIHDWSRGYQAPVASFEPDYGRLAEAQVQWESRHAEAFPVVPPSRS